MEYSTAVTKKLVPRFLEDLAELIIDKTKGEEQVGGMEKIFEAPRLRELSDYDSVKKKIVVEGKNIHKLHYSNTGSQNNLNNYNSINSHHNRRGK